MTAALPVRLRLLVVDDNEVDIETVRRQLRAAGMEAEVLAAPTVTDGLRELEAGEFDCALIDYRLPDGDGLELIRSAITRLRPPTPLILLTLVQDERIGMTAIGDGADDYLVKAQVTGPLLSRSIRYAIERGKNRVARETRDAIERHDQELETLTRVVGSEAAPHTSRAFGIVSLREGSPHQFEGLRARYAEILDLSLEQRAFKVDNRVSERLMALADDLGLMQASPRDVVELHTTVLRAADFAGPGSRIRAVAEEGRILVLELMGHLAHYYRTNSIRRPRSRAPEPEAGGRDG